MESHPASLAAAIQHMWTDFGSSKLYRVLRISHFTLFEQSCMRNEKNCMRRRRNVEREISPTHTIKKIATVN